MPAEMTKITASRASCNEAHPETMTRNSEAQAQNEKPLGKREGHNIIEKKRKDRLKIGLEELRKVLPDDDITNKRKTHHDVLEAACNYIRTLECQNREMLLGNTDAVHVEIIKRLQTENTELKHENRKFREMVESAGFPPIADLTKLVLSWKWRSPPSTQNSKPPLTPPQPLLPSTQNSKLPPTPPQPPIPPEAPTAVERKRKRQGHTISERLKEIDALTKSSSEVGGVVHDAVPQVCDDVTVSHVTSIQLASNDANVSIPLEPSSQILGMIIADQATSDNAGSNQNQASESCVSGSCLSDTSRCWESGQEISLVVKERPADRTSEEVITDNICVGMSCDETVDMPNDGASCATSMVVADHLSLLSAPLSATISGDGKENKTSTPDKVLPCSSVNNSTASGMDSVVVAVHVAEPSQQLCRPMLVSNKLLPIVSNQNNSILLDIDIGTNLLGSGLVCGSFIYHEGRLVLGRHRLDGIGSHMLPLFTNGPLSTSTIALVLSQSPFLPHTLTQPSAGIIAVAASCNPAQLNEDTSADVASGLGLSTASAFANSNTALTAEDMATKCTNEESAVKTSSPSTMSDEQTTAFTTCADCQLSEVLPVDMLVNQNQRSCDEKTTEEHVPPVGASDEIPVTGIHDDCLSANTEAETAERSLELSSVQMPPSHEGRHQLASVPVAADEQAGCVSISSDLPRSSTPKSLATSASNIETSVMSPTVSDSYVFSTPGDVEPMFDSPQLEHCFSLVPHSVSDEMSMVPNRKRKLFAGPHSKGGSKAPKSQRLRSDKHLNGNVVSKCICPPPDPANIKDDSEIIIVMDRLADRSFEPYFFKGNVSGEPSGVSRNSTLDSYTVQRSHSLVSEDLWRPETFPPPSVGEPIRQETVSSEDNSLSDVARQSKLVGEDQFGRDPRVDCGSNLFNGESSSDNGFAKSDSIAQSAHNKGFALANFLPFAQQNASMFVDSQQDMETAVTSAAAEPSKWSRVSYTSQNPHDSYPYSGTLPTAARSFCVANDSVLTDDLSSLTDDWSALLNDAEVPSLMPMKNTLDTGLFWNLGFGSSSSGNRLRDKGKDGLMEYSQFSKADLGQSVVNLGDPFILDTDATQQDRADVGIRSAGVKSCFDVSSLTSKAPDSTPSWTTPYISDGFPCAAPFHTYQQLPSVPGISLPTECPPAAAVSHMEFLRYAGSESVAENSTAAVCCKTVTSSSSEPPSRGIFSLAHHATVSTSSKGPSHSQYSDVSTRTTNSLWSPCVSGPVYISSSSRTLPPCTPSAYSSHNQQQWRAGELSSTNFAGSWDDPFYGCVGDLHPGHLLADAGQSVHRMSRLPAQQVDAGFEFCRTGDAPFGFQPVAEAPREKQDCRWTDGEFCPFPTSHKKAAAPFNDHQSSKGILNDHLQSTSFCQYSGRQTENRSANDQPSWKLPRCTESLSLPTTKVSSYNEPKRQKHSMKFDFSIQPPPAIQPPVTSHKLPPFSFTSIPPITDFLTFGLAPSTGAVVSTHATSSTLHFSNKSAADYLSERPPVSVTSRQSSDTVLSTSGSHISADKDIAARYLSQNDVTKVMSSKSVHSSDSTHKTPLLQSPQVSSQTLLSCNPWKDTVVATTSCQFPAVSSMNPCATQMMPPYGTFVPGGLYPGGAAAFVSSSLTSPPLHHPPMVNSVRPGICTDTERHLGFEPAFALPRLPLSAPVLSFNAPSFESSTAVLGTTSGDIYTGSGMFRVGTETSSAASHRVVSIASNSIPPCYPLPAVKPTGSRRSSKCGAKQQLPKQTSDGSSGGISAPLYFGFSSAKGAAVQPTDVPTYFPSTPLMAGNPFSSGGLRPQSLPLSSSHGVDCDVTRTFDSMFHSPATSQPSISLKFSQSTATTCSASSNPVPKSGHLNNFGINKFFSDLTNPGAVAAPPPPPPIRGLGFPPPPAMGILPESVVPLQYSQELADPRDKSRPVRQHVPHNSPMHNMSINSLLGHDPRASGPAHFESWSSAATATSSAAIRSNVPMLNFNLHSNQPRSQSHDRPRQR